MLTLENVLWVVPGIVFIFGYNNLRPVGHINLSGWPYVFFLVFIAAVTWLPAEWMVDNYVAMDFFSETILILLCSMGFSLIFLLLIKLIPLPQIFSAYYDDFCLNCINWEKYPIFLTLKNGKVYVGLLWKYSESPMLQYEFQTISIVPIYSGFRGKDKTIEWNTYYPEYEDEEDINSMETIIPRSEIVTFGKFNERVHQHFTTPPKSTTTPG